MSKFSKTDEKEFLIGYHTFTSRVRTQLIKQLTDQYSQAKDFNEKAYCHIMAMEQIYLSYEAFEGVLRAFKESNKKPFLDTMAKDQDVRVIVDWLKNKDSKAIVKSLDYKKENFDFKTQEAIEKRLSGIVAFWQTKDLVPFINEVFIPLSNKLKHKLMVYKKDENIKFALEDVTDQRSSNFLKKLGIKSPSPMPKDIKWILKLAKLFEYAIQDLIALRLYELGVKPDELHKIIEENN